MEPTALVFVTAVVALLIFIFLLLVIVGAVNLVEESKLTDEEITHISTAAPYVSVPLLKSALKESGIKSKKKKESR